MKHGAKVTKSDISRRTFSFTESQCGGDATYRTGSKPTGPQLKVDGFKEISNVQLVFTKHGFHICVKIDYVCVISLL